jgi:hypothetical protein
LRLDEVDRAARRCLARYGTRWLVSPGRLEYDRVGGTVTYASDKRDGPTAGRHTFGTMEFIARLVAHVPEKGRVMQRYYGHHANRTRGERRRAESTVADTSVDAGRPATEPDLPEGGDATGLEAQGLSRGDAKRRCAEPIRQVCDVDRMDCPRRGSEMREMALIQEPAAVDKIPRHLRDKGRDARAGP